MLRGKVPLLSGKNNALILIAQRLPEPESIHKILANFTAALPPICTNCGATPLRLAFHFRNIDCSTEGSEVGKQQPPLAVSNDIL